MDLRARYRPLVDFDTRRHLLSALHHRLSIQPADQRGLARLAVTDEDGADLVERFKQAAIAQMFQVGIDLGGRLGEYLLRDIERLD